VKGSPVLDKKSEQIKSQSEKSEGKEHSGKEHHKGKKQWEAPIESKYL